MSSPQDLTEDAVVTKYKLAAEICSKALAGLIKAAVPGKSTLELCKVGDLLLKAQSDAVYKNKKDENDKPIQKGTAFPTCVSLNDCVCHNSPLLSDAEPQILKEGDVCKIDLGCHIDGYLAVAAHTLVVGGGAEGKVTGKAADVCMAALHAAQAACKTIQVGASNQDVTKVIKQIAEAYGVSACQGVLMHQMKRCVVCVRVCVWRASPSLPLGVALPMRCRGFHSEAR
jgi:curved DNA binding protein